MTSESLHGDDLNGWDSQNQVDFSHLTTLLFKRRNEPHPDPLSSVIDQSETDSWKLLIGHMIRSSDSENSSD